MAKAAKKAGKTEEAAPEGAGGNGSTQGAAPSMKILGQYVKDLRIPKPRVPWQARRVSRKSTYL